MADETSSPEKIVPPTDPAVIPAMTEAQKSAVSSAKGSIWKKVLWWVLGILGVIAVIITFVFLFLPRKDGKNTMQAIIDKTKKETDKADVDAKVAVAKAEGVAEERIAEIKKTTEIEDTNERRKRLAELL